MTYGIDPDGPGTGGEREDLECGEVGFTENIDFEVLTPGEDFDQFRSPVYESFVLGAELFVDDSGETCQADKPSNLGGKISPSDSPPSHSARPP